MRISTNLLLRHTSDVDFLLQFLMDDDSVIQLSINTPYDIPRAKWEELIYCIERGIKYDLPFNRRQDDKQNGIFCTGSHISFILPLNSSMDCNIALPLTRHKLELLTAFKTLILHPHIIEKWNSQPI